MIFYKGEDLTVELPRPFVLFSIICTCQQLFKQIGGQFRKPSLWMNHFLVLISFFSSRVQIPVGHKFLSKTVNKMLHISDHGSSSTT